MGKSRLLADLAQARNEAGPKVVLAQARPGDAGVSFALATRMLKALLRDFRVAPASADLPLLARLLPEMGEVPLAAVADPSRLAGAVARVIRSAAGAGLAAVLVDDLQFADEASIDLLRLLLAERVAAGYWPGGRMSSERPPRDGSMLSRPRRRSRP